jgi:uncharacterized protein (DUF302 family)
MLNLKIKTMKKPYIILGLIIFSATLVMSQTKDGMFIESLSKYNFEETVNKLSEEVSTKGWKVLVTHNLQESMKKNGYDILPVKVMEICNPEHSVKLLELENERIYSSLMPCRISVYEKLDGKTYISRMNSGMLAGQIGGIVEEVMTMATDDMEEMVKVVVN